MYLLDTNVISEITKPRPEERALDWLDSVDEDRTYLSVITVGELRAGSERMPISRARQGLELWLEAVIERFRDRVLPVDLDIAAMYGRLVAQGKAAGRSGNPPDVLIAATAVWHGLTVATRNVKDFEHTEVEVLNPWEEPD